MDLDNQLLGYVNTTAVSRLTFVHITGATQAAQTVAKATEQRFGKEKDPSEEP